MYSIKHIHKLIQNTITKYLADEFRLFLENTNLNSKQIMVLFVHELNKYGIIEMVEKDYSVWWLVKEKDQIIKSGLLKNAMIDSLKSTMGQ
jgi:hypothetical protein